MECATDRLGVYFLPNQGKLSWLDGKMRLCWGCVCVFVCVCVCEREREREEKNKSEAPGSLKVLLLAEGFFFLFNV